MALLYLISQLPPGGADQHQPRDKKSSWQPGGNWWGENGKTYCSLPFSLLFCTFVFWGFLFCYSLFITVCGANHFGSFLCILCPCSKTKKKKAGNGTLCWVSPGVGNEGLSNGDSYFILSIIYGETRFRKGHCVNMGVACHKQLEGVQNRWWHMFLLATQCTWCHFPVLPICR